MALRTRQDDESPVFAKSRVSYTPPSSITHFCCANSYLIIALDTKVLLCKNLDYQQDNFDEIPFGRPDDKLTSLLLDPSGYHTILCMESGESFYLNRGSKKIHILSRLKDYVITAVGWNIRASSESSTGEILIGTSNGLLLETQIMAGDEGIRVKPKREQYLKQVWSIVPDEVQKQTEITNIKIERIPSETTSDYRYFFLVTTKTQFYQFVSSIPASTEAPIFQHVFSAYKDVPKGSINLQGECERSKLDLFRPDLRSVSTKFSWMCGAGIYCGKIDTTGLMRPDIVAIDSELIPYPRKCPNFPIDIIMTEFHTVLIYSNSLRAINILDEKIVHEDSFQEKFGNVLGAWKDEAKKIIYVYAEKAIYKYKIDREERNVWRCYLDKRAYGLAKQHAKDNPKHLDLVLTKEAEYHFMNRDYSKSAKLYAQTSASFEEVALRFIGLEQTEPLQVYLRKKLKSLSPNDKTQSALITTWLVEIYLDELGKLREKILDPNDPEYLQLQSVFRNFINDSVVKDCVYSHRDIVYNLIASHGAEDDMMFFAVLMKDYEKVISHYVQSEDYPKALEYLIKHSDLNEDASLFYKFSPLLMQHLPKETVNAWISQKRALDPSRLIPALVRYDRSIEQNIGDSENEAIRYVEYCTKELRNKEKAIHNYLISLYAKLKPNDLITYLELQGEDEDSVCYDVKYALRVCSDLHLERACIHIYSTMKLYEEAVKLALKVDVDLAKKNASKAKDEETKKKLWLLIAKHVVQTEKDVEKTMKLLEGCDLINIEDVLPFFPDFVTIDHFKDAICSSLEQYNEHINNLKQEMQQATDSSKEIRAQMQALRNKYACISASDKCHSCSQSLLTRPFHVFPCSHRFHTDCLVICLLPCLSSNEREKLETLRRKLDAATAPNGRHFQRSVSKIGGIQNEIDDIIARDCFLCGSVMIEAIDKPFIDENRFQEEMESWM
ncbi:DgyrCDS4731 [Dimorphilus gyrociliatus]|uniref:Vacuolar protein sorting-associated protein 18 homolog n=1 Tax=Dimorphilus gyrociliatus TaxID=2664684 RepID=A0A7I8VJ96_9ANNE|nr:DgyrCDS4731 [Dimorphilus gyrociliatus]